MTQFSPQQEAALSAVSKWFKAKKSKQAYRLFGYALTVHKSQGSQWDNVTILDESGAFRESAKLWLYTAITRAAEQVTVAI